MLRYMYILYDGQLANLCRTSFVVEPEGFLELLHHGLLVLLNEELGRQLQELGELDLARTCSNTVHLRSFIHVN